MPLIEMGKEYRTRDGRAARVLCVDGPDKRYPVVAVIQDAGCADWTPEDFTTTGLIVTADKNPEDLIEVKPEVKGWVNIYPKNRFSEADREKVSNTHTTKEIANKSAVSGRIACIPITFREGDGLEDGEK